MLESIQIIKEILSLKLVKVIGVRTKKFFTLQFKKRSKQEAIEKLEYRVKILEIENAELKDKLSKCNRQVVYMTKRHKDIIRRWKIPWRPDALD